MIDCRLRRLLEGGARPNAVHVFAHMMRLTDRKGWCSRDELPSHTGLSRHPIEQALEDLVRFRVIEATRVGRVVILNLAPTNVDNSQMAGCDSTRADSDTLLSDSDTARSDSDTTVSDPDTQREEEPAPPAFVAECDRAVSDPATNGPAEPLAPTRARTSRPSSVEEGVLSFFETLPGGPPCPPSGGELEGAPKGGETPQLQFRKPPASTTKSNLLNAGFSYDPATQVWTAERDTPRARELVQQFARYCVPVGTPNAPAGQPARARPMPPRSPPPPQPPLPETDERLRGVFAGLEARMLARVWRTFCRPEVLAFTLDGARVIAWTAGPDSADYLREHHQETVTAVLAEILGRPAEIEWRTPNRKDGAHEADKGVRRGLPGNGRAPFPGDGGGAAAALPGPRRPDRAGHAGAGQPALRGEGGGQVQGERG